MKAKLMVCAILVLLAAGLQAEDHRFRDIFDTQYIGFSDNTWFSETENVLLFYLNPVVEPTARVTITKTDAYLKALFQLGSVVIFKPGLYAEGTYGVSVNDTGLYSQEGTYGFSVNDSGRYTQEGFVEITREAPKYIASARVKGGYVQATKTLFLIPDASFQYQFNTLYAGKAKYFFGWNTDSFYSHSLELENIFTIRKIYTVSAITTGIWEDVDGESYKLWSAGFRVQGFFTEWLALKYLFLYHSLENDKWGIENGITVDIKL